MTSPNDIIATAVRDVCSVSVTAAPKSTVMKILEPAFKAYVLSVVAEARKSAGYYSFCSMHAKSWRQCQTCVLNDEAQRMGAASLEHAMKKLIG